MALEPITRQEKIIAGQDLTPITRMEKFLKNFGGTGGGGCAQPDLSQTDTTKPDYVKGVIRQESLPDGYPYKEKTVIEWDGGADGLYCVNDTWYLVSDEVISDDVLRNGTVTLITENVVTEKPVGPHWDALVQQGLISEDVSGLMEATVVVVRKPGVSMMGEGPFERTGTYFVNSYGMRVDKFVSETIHPIAEEFMPALTSPNGTKYKLTVADDGALSAVAVS